MSRLLTEEIYAVGFNFFDAFDEHGKRWHGTLQDVESVDDTKKFVTILISYDVSARIHIDSIILEYKEGVKRHHLPVVEVRRFDDQTEITGVMFSR